MTPAERVALAFLAGGLAGWALENVFARSSDAPLRFSNGFGRAPVPFLPVYGFGAAAVVLAAPYLRTLPAGPRAVAYGAGLSGLEWIAGLADRSLGPPSWDYGQGATTSLGHAAIWGLLALGVEGMSG